MTEAAEKVEVMENESRELAPVQQESSALLAIIERVAMSPDADITKLERMVAMQKEMRASKAWG